MPNEKNGFHKIIQFHTHEFKKNFLTHSVCLFSPSRKVTRVNLRRMYSCNCNRCISAKRQNRVNFKVVLLLEPVHRNDLYATAIGTLANLQSLLGLWKIAFLFQPEFLVFLCLYNDIHHVPVFNSDLRFLCLFWSKCRSSSVLIIHLDPELAMSNPIHLTNYICFSHFIKCHRAR